MATVFVRVEGENQIQSRLRELQGRVGSLRPALDEIGAAMVSSTQRRFRNGVDPEGSRWPLSQRAMTENGQTLVDTARLRQSITHQATRTEVAVGTNVLYARTHQFGAEIKAKTGRGLIFRVAGGRMARVPKVTIGARPFLGINSADSRTIVDIIGDYLTGRAGA